MVCERWWLTKMVDKDGVWKMVCVKDGVWKIVVDKDVCERWCVRDGLWKMVCERWWLTKMVDKDGVWKMCEEEAAGGGRRRGGGEEPGIQIKNKNPTQRCGELWKITIEIVNFPWNMVIFRSYVSLPKGTILYPNQPSSRFRSGHPSSSLNIILGVAWYLL